MASTIKIKNSSTAGAIPTSSDLVQGELAVNVTDKTIFTENASGTVVELGKNYTGFKNRIINGAMMIDQRNAGASVTPADGQYLTDRFKASINQTGKFTAQQNAGSVTPPSGFKNYLGMTSTSAYSVGSGDYLTVNQIIEGFNCADLGWGTASAQTVTLSFWVRSSLTGSFGGALTNSAINRSYPFTYTVSTANTWEQKTVTVAGDTTGTWLTDNTIGMRVFFSLGAGATVSGASGSWAGSLYVSATGATSVVGTNGATFYITGVQLEKGSTATSFDYRSYGTELALCQRYCEVIKPSGTVSYSNLAIGQNNATTNASVVYFYQVAKRAAPSVTYDTATKYGLTVAAGGVQQCSSISTDRCDVTSLAIQAFVASGLVAGYATRLLDYGTNYPLTIISAEL
jgi:hypothetical protein